MTDAPRDVPALKAEARVSRLPWRDIDGGGYAYGGDVILTVGPRAILIGNSPECEVLARQLADAWNRHAPSETKGGDADG